ncbi:MAG: hypothetical protein U0105_14305 [Candidatus Obscuribacterales bacterium]
MNRPRVSKKSILFMILAVVAAALSVPAQAQNCPAPCRDPYAQMQLSPQQRQRIQGYQQQWNEQYAQLQPQLRVQQQRLVALLSNPQSDALEISQTQQRISSLQQQLSTQATMNILQKRRILNDQQRQQLRQMMTGMLGNRPRPRGF